MTSPKSHTKEQQNQLLLSRPKRRLLVCYRELINASLPAAPVHYPPITYLVNTYNSLTVKYKENPNPSMTICHLLTETMEMSLLRPVSLTCSCCNRMLLHKPIACVTSVGVRTLHQTPSSWKPTGHSTTFHTKVKKLGKRPHIFREKWKMSILFVILALGRQLPGLAA